MNNHWLKPFLICILLGAAGLSVSARVVPSKLFADNMVLQQQTDAPIWGKANPNKQVKLTTSWDNQTYTVLASASGSWALKVKTPKAGGPYTITISDGKELKLNNVMIGEVWICSGQSNMEMQLAGWGKVNNYEQEIANADYSQIRLFHVEKASSGEEQSELGQTRGWDICSPTNVADFSAVAYFFGRNLNQNLNVPIGLISTSWGGTIAEAWTSAESLQYMPYFTEELKHVQGISDEQQQRAYESEFKVWDQKVRAADKKAYDSADGWKVMTVPGMWEGTVDGMDGFDGIVWFKKTVTIPAEWEGKELELELGGIDDYDLTYFNGQQVGETSAYGVSHTYTIPGKLVKKGEASILVRMTDTGGDGGFYDNSKPMGLKLKGSDETIPLAGKWAMKPTVNFKDFGRIPKVPTNNPNRPTVLYNAMINPIIPYAIKGAIWYQGESNVDRTYQYRELFPLMIRDWRMRWGKDFPFYFVQLANYMERNSMPVESAWAELREAQLQTLKLENTGMAVTIDIGEAKDIHPKNKQDVGLRLALAARANTYGEKIAYSGPIYKGHQLEDDKIRISFDHVDGGLKAKGVQVKGFSIAGPDHKFQWADAVIEGDEIVVSAAGVRYPVAVRYAWSDNPECNLYNGAGLPASPFRTDDWKR